MIKDKPNIINRDTRDRDGKLEKQIYIYIKPHILIKCYPTKVKTQPQTREAL